MRKAISLFLTIALVFSLASSAWAAGLDQTSAATATRTMLCAALWEREESPVVNCLTRWQEKPSGISTRQAAAAAVQA